MTVRATLALKGSAVTTVTPDITLEAAAHILSEAGIGAAVVSTDGRTIEGIISERDIVRAIGESQGDGTVLQRPVARAMTHDVVTCRPDDRISALMVIMTQRRIRHLPVLDDEGKLAGIISIGDVVKRRMEEIQSEADAMRRYIMKPY